MFEAKLWNFPGEFQNLAAKFFTHHPIQPTRPQVKLGEVHQSWHLFAQDQSLWGIHSWSGYNSLPTICYYHFVFNQWSVRQFYNKSPHQQCELIAEGHITCGKTHCKRHFNRNKHIKRKRVNHKWNKRNFPDLEHADCYPSLPKGCLRELIFNISIDV